MHDDRVVVFVFEETGHDLLVVAADGEKAVGSAELAGEVAVGEDEDGAGRELVLDGGEELLLPLVASRDG